MSSSGSGDGRRGGRRPAPRRPAGGQRPSSRPEPRRSAPAPEPAEDDDATQAFNIADFDFDEPDYVDEDESTVSVDSAALRARASRSAPPASDDDEGEATVAMQIPQELLDEGAKGAKKTILGHPGISPRTANAVRGGAKAPRRNETLAMDAQNVRRAAAQAAASDDDEATQAMNVDDMLAAIDEAAAPPPARRSPPPARRSPPPARAPEPAPADDDDATQAMNMDAMLAEIDDAPPARPAPRRAAPPPQEDEEENESTMAVDMDAMLAEIDGGGAPADEDEKTQAMDISMLDDIDMAPPKAKAPRRAAPEPEPVPVGDDDDWASAAAAEVEELPPAIDASGFFGSMKYALAFDGRKTQLEDQIAAIDGELQAGGGRSRTELSRMKQEYEAEHAALDAGKAKTGWIMLGSIGGGLGVVLMIIGLI